MTTLDDLVQQKSAESKSVNSSPFSSPVANNRVQVPNQPDQITRISRDPFEATSISPNSFVPETLSSASSFQSLTSNHSSKYSDSIGTDSALGSPDKTGLICDVDNLIGSCLKLNLNDSPTLDSPNNSTNLSHDQTFASATNDTIANETQIELRLEESIQTFETCPILETNQILKIDVISSNIADSSVVDANKTSTIPKVSFENSEQQRHNNEIELKNSHNFLQKNNTSSKFINKVDLIQEDPQVCLRNGTVIEVNDVDDFSVNDFYDQKEQQNAANENLSDRDKNIEVLNHTTVLSSEFKIDESNKFFQGTTNNFNSATLKYENNQLDVKTTNKNELFKEKDNILKYTKNESKLIIQTKNILNETEFITHQNNILNKTQSIETDKSFVEKDDSINKIQNITEKSNSINNNKILVKDQCNTENPKIQNVNKNSNIDKYFDQTEAFLKRSDPTFNEEIQHLNSVSRPILSDSKKNECEFSKEIISPNKIQTNEEIKIKNPSKPRDLLFIKKKVEISNSNETLLLEKSHKTNESKIEVVASTPLPLKTYTKENTKESLRRKSALFDREYSNLQLKNEKVINTLSKKEYMNDDGNNIIFDETVAVNKSFEKLFSPELDPKDNFELSIDHIHENSLNLLPPQESEYEAFKPQQQSTNLPFPNSNNIQALQEAALSVAKDIDDSLEKIEESEHFVSATNELFGDPSALDFLNDIGTQITRRGERYDSLYMKFDPLAEKLSMLSQKNVPASPLLNEEEEKELHVTNSISNVGTPKKNPALAAIDRLLFYSPCSVPSTDTEVSEAIQKKEVLEKEHSLTPIVDEKMAKELELVRSTVLQLETQNEKQRQEYKEQLDKQKDVFEDRISLLQTKYNQMQSQLTQEVKCKEQMTVVVEEYEKSISRLIAEREKDRTNFEVEKAKIQEELQVANQHLSNTEAAFSDVHSKYERLKNVVSAYKSNETVLKESIAENQETINILENRYEQLKNHAMAQLEKANLELNAIRKHNDAETVKLKALVRKAELKTKSLEETVEQKMKENKELTQIIDEMIARVD